MRFFLFLILIFSLSSMAHSGYEFARSGNNNGQNESSGQVDKLKLFIEKGRDLVRQFDPLLSRYESTVNKLKVHKQNCGLIGYSSSDVGTIFDTTGPCKSGLERLIKRIRKQARELDIIEAEMIAVKRDIKRAQNTLTVHHSFDTIDDEVDKLGKDIDDQLIGKEALDASTRM